MERINQNIYKQQPPLKVMKKIRCPKCGYIWETKSKLLYTTCVSCQRKFEISKAILDSNKLQEV